MYSFRQIKLNYLYQNQTYSIQLEAGQVTAESKACSIVFSEADALSGIRWKLSAETDAEIELQSLEINAFYDFSAIKHFFCNGFQSWSESKIYTPEDTIKGLKKLAKPFMNPYGDYTYYDYPEQKGVLHSWMYTYFKLPRKRICFIGSLSEKDAFTNFVYLTKENTLSIIRDVKGLKINGSVDIADIFQTVHTEFAAFQHYAMLNEWKEIVAKPSIGWTSWYHYYTKISAQIIEKNLRSFKEKNLPIDIFQIDDGYQQAVGDWLKINNRFPKGMKDIADKIKNQGYKAGIWLAPLACEKKSEIFTQKQHWLLKDQAGKPLKIGYNPLWSGWFYALDIYNEEVRTYVKEVFRIVCREWGFDLVKLDFLYGACLMASNGKSRAGVMNDAMQLLREAVGNDKEILGCGIPLGIAPEWTDYCRIGPDVHLKWEFSALKWSGNRERVSTFLALQNTIHRHHLNQLAFINDPDVFMLRKKKQALSKIEQYTLLLTNLIFGDVLFTSDDIAEYDEQATQWYTSIFPLMKKEELHVEKDGDLYKVRFSIRDRHFLAYINLGNKARTYKLPVGLYFDTLDKDVVSGETVINVVPHQSHCYHIAGSGAFAVLGSNGYFFSGAEVEKIVLKGNDIQLTLIKGLQTDPELYLKVPLDFECDSVNGRAFRKVKKKDYAILVSKTDRNEINTANHF